MFSNGTISFFPPGPRLTLAMIDSFESSPASVTSLVQAESDLFAEEIGFVGKYADTLQNFAKVYEQL
jgi:hypothetical protein